VIGRAACLVLALAAGAAASDAPPTRPCETWARPPERVGATPKPLHELSGLVASLAHPGIFWGHNDSDNAFELIAIHADGTIVATYRIADASAVDVEDIARGPCLDGSGRTCIVLGDIGDNLEVRRSAQLWEVPEPERLADGAIAGVRLPFTYEDGSHNAETLLIDASGHAWVVTKRLDDLGRLYRLDDLGPDRVGVAHFVRRLRAPSGFGALTTGGDLHPAGGRILLRTYTTVWEYRGAPGDDVATILATMPIEAPAPRQPQGEAIAYDPDGRGYLVGSEKTGAPLYRIHCAPDAP
jgi:hypothetical protein